MVLLLECVRMMCSSEHIKGNMSFGNHCQSHSITVAPGWHPSTLTVRVSESAWSSWPWPGYKSHLAAAADDCRCAASHSELWLTNTIFSDYAIFNDSSLRRRLLKTCCGQKVSFCGQKDFNHKDIPGIFFLIQG